MRSEYFGFNHGHMSVEGRPAAIEPQTLARNHNRARDPRETLREWTCTGLQLYIGPLMYGLMISFGAKYHSQLDPAEKYKICKNFDNFWAF